MVIRMRHTRAHTGNRRSHHALKGGAFSNCANCGKPHVPHTVCMACGQYRGRKVIDQVKAVTKKTTRSKK